MDIKEIRREKLKEFFKNKSIPPNEKSYLSQLMGGKAPFGEKAARRLENDYGMGALYLDSPSQETKDNVAQDRAEYVAGNTVKSKVFATHPDDPPQDGMVYVKESRLSFAAGNGKISSYELIEDEEPAGYRLSWFQKNGMKPEKVRRFRISGDSMEPMLFDGNTILVNTEETNIIDNKVYAIRYGDDLRVKFLIKKLDGTLILRSMNPHYKDEEIPPEMAAEHISIIGRVRDQSGMGGF